MLLTLNHLAPYGLLSSEAVLFVSHKTLQLLKLQAPWRSWGVPGFQDLFHLRRSGALVTGFDVQSFHSGHFLSFLNQLHHLCKGKLLRLWACRCLWWWVFWRGPLVQLFTPSMGRRVPRLVVVLVYWLNKPEWRRGDQRGHLTKINQYGWQTVWAGKCLNKHLSNYTSLVSFYHSTADFIS